MTKWKNADWQQGVRFGFKANYWANRAVDFLAGMAIGLLIMIWAVYA